MKHPIKKFFFVVAILFCFTTNAQKEVNFDSSGFRSVMNRAKAEHGSVCTQLRTTQER